MDLAGAITLVEQTQGAYNTANAQTQNDQAAAVAIQTKLDAAKATVVSDQASQATAAKAFNDSLDALIASATAAKIP